MATKRSASDDDSSAIVLKKQKTSDQAIIGSVTKEGIKRTSNLLSPIMQLVGHQGEVYGCRFNPDGDVIASCSFDKTILLWRTFGECENFMLLKGHKNAVLDLAWFTDGESLVTCSADKSVRCWDTVTGQQVKRLSEHTGIVNGVSPLRRGPRLFASAGDDSTMKVWDMRVKRSVQSVEDKYQMTSVAFSDAGDQVFTGGIDHNIQVWDLRKGVSALVLSGHTDSVTGVRLSPDGSHLLSNAMDHTLRVWDVRPYAPANRCVKVFTGHMHNFEKNLLRCDWSADASRVTCGSGDQHVYVWDALSRRLMYKLPGHRGSVNDATFHPKEPIVASCSSDRTLFLGELMS